MNYTADARSSIGSKSAVLQTGGSQVKRNRQGPRALQTVALQSKQHILITPQPAGAKFQRDVLGSRQRQRQAGANAVGPGVAPKDRGHIQALASRRCLVGNRGKFMRSLKSPPRSP